MTLVVRPFPSVALGACTIMDANSPEANRQGNLNYSIFLRYTIMRCIYLGLLHVNSAVDLQLCSCQILQAENSESPCPLHSRHKHATTSQNKLH